MLRQFGLAPLCPSLRVFIGAPDTRCQRRDCHAIIIGPCFPFPARPKSLVPHHGRPFLARSRKYAKQFGMNDPCLNHQGFGDRPPETSAALHRKQYPNCYACLPPNTKASMCPHTGLRHAHLAKLLKPGGMAAAHVRVVTLREPGARRGKTLFHLGDMLQWLDDLATKPDTAMRVKEGGEP